MDRPDTLQTTEPLVHTNLQPSNRQARELVHYADAGELDLDPPYQRGAVWETWQQIGLVRSWLLGLPIPAVIVSDRDHAGWYAASNGGVPIRSGAPTTAVVDGKQRILAATAWFHGDLAVPASWFPADHVEETVDTADGPYVTHHGLTEKGRRFVGNRAMFPVVTTHLDTVEEEARVFNLVNAAGVAQTDADLARAAAVAAG